MLLKGRKAILLYARGPVNFRLFREDWLSQPDSTFNYGKQLHGRENNAKTVNICIEFWPRKISRKHIHTSYMVYLVKRAEE